MEIVIEIKYDKSDKAHRLDAVGVSGRDVFHIERGQVTEIRFFRRKADGESAIEQLSAVLTPAVERGYSIPVSQPWMIDIHRTSNPGNGEAAFLLGEKDQGPCILYLDANAIGLSGPGYEIARAKYSGTVYSTWDSVATGPFRCPECSLQEEKADIVAEQGRLSEVLKRARTGSEVDNLLKDISAIPLRYRLLQEYWARLTPEQYKTEKEAIKRSMAVDQKYRYQLLDQLRVECLRYLDGKGQALCAGDAKTQIAVMRALWKSFKEDKRPKWLPLRDIDELELKMVYGRCLD